MEQDPGVEREGRGTPVRGTYSQAEETAGARTYPRNERTEVRGQGVRVEAGKRPPSQLGPCPWRALNATVRTCHFILLLTESWKQQGLGDTLVGWGGGGGRKRRHISEGRNPQTEQMNNKLN